MFHVLIVEDEFWMCEGLKKIFHKLEVGFTVADTAANGQEALKKLQVEASIWSSPTFACQSWTD